MKHVTLTLCLLATSPALAKSHHYYHKNTKIRFQTISLLETYQNLSPKPINEQLIRKVENGDLLPVKFEASGALGFIGKKLIVAGHSNEKPFRLSIPSEARVRTFAYRNDWHFIELSSPLEVIELSQKLAFDVNVRFAHPVFHFPIEARRIEDPLVEQQWHLENTGQRGGTPGADLKIKNAWSITKGSPSTVVGLIDLGFEQSHPDLEDSWYTNQGEIPNNKIDDDNNGKTDDVKGWNFDLDTNQILYGSAPSHGTATAGVIGARENGIGVTGGCPQCKTLPMVIYTDTEHAVSAFYYAAEHGVRVLSNSWGYAIGTPETQMVSEALTDVAENANDGKGMSILFAMPNRHTNACNPRAPDISAHPNVIAISSIDYHDVKVENAGYGSCLQFVGSTSGSQINGVVTTDRQGQKGYNTGNTSYPDLSDLNYTQSFYGTSAATPAVASVFALLYSQNPEWTATEVLAKIRQTTDKVSTVQAQYDESGHSLEYGYGRPNAYRALTQ